MMTNLKNKDLKWYGKKRRQEYEYNLKVMSHDYHQKKHGIFSLNKLSLKFNNSLMQSI